MLQETIRDKFLKAFENIEYGSLTLHTPDGKTLLFQGNQPGENARLSIKDWRTFTLFATRGDIGLTEAYRDGWWETDDLTALLAMGLRNDEHLNDFMYGNFISRAVLRFMHFLNSNTLNGSKRNIHAHYDIGNEFFELWLDPSMTYSSALYNNASDTLEQAQYNKYDRMIERLGTTSGSLIEVGCGWGGFAERALQKHDFGIRGITLSEEQKSYADKRLGGGADIVLEDYRKQEGTFDNIISIEMFEAVGEKYWPTYFDKLTSMLNNNGRAVVQTITIGEKYFDTYRKTNDMIRAFIFPGGMLPTKTRFEQEANRAGLRVNDNFAFGQDYATTLREWLATFEAKLPQIRAQGFDEQFIRLWRFYLCACIAGFDVKRTDVIQVELSHAA